MGYIEPCFPFQPKPDGQYPQKLAEMQISEEGFKRTREPSGKVTVFDSPFPVVTICVTETSPVFNSQRETVSKQIRKEAA